MLTQNDRNAIRDLIRDELKSALVRTITIERGPRQQGDPEKVIKEEQWNVLDFLAAYAPKIEAALRGMQEDVDKTKNAVAVSAMKVEAIGKILLGLEQSALRLAAAGDEVKRLGFGAPDLSLLSDRSDPIDPSDSLTQGGTL